MRCPFCQDDNDRVIDSRSCEDGFSTRRRRECLNCKRRYTTYERLEELDIKVVKKDGVREPFDPNKIREGISKACWKRPISAEQIDAVVADIQGQLYANFEKEIDSTQLGQIIMDHLRGLDQVAYVRFASVYREFKDANDFVEEVKPMLDDSKRVAR
jgi:transcriptional repressor NrdR